jgi:hypothetical protein
MSIFSIWENISELNQFPGGCISQIITSQSGKPSDQYLIIIL